MSSRQQEKEQRRREREEAERAAAVAAARRKRLGMVGGGVLVVAIIAVIAIVVAGSGGGDNSSASAPSGKTAALPAAKLTDLTAAAKAAGCTVKSWPNQGRGHTTADVKYKTNPPTSGPHDPTPAEDGIYDPSNPPDIQQSVHSLEHGRVEFQYRPGTPEKRISQLDTLFNEKVKGTAGYHTLLFQNRTDMPYAVAATSWQHSITCPTFDDKTFDALRAFRLQNVDHAPEFIP